MSQRTKKYLLVSMIALMIGAGLIVGCVSQQAQTNQKTNIEGVPTINTNPEVIWGDSQWYNPIGKAYETSFKIPERYALRPYQAGNGKYIPRSLALTTPDLKPLPEEKQDCRSTTQLTAECLSNVMEIEFGHDLNRQVFKDMGINEDNYLNYYFDKNRAENYHIDINTYYTKQSEKQNGLTTYYRSLLVNEFTPAGKKIELDDFFPIYIDFDESGNVRTVIECPSIKISDENYISKNRMLPICTHRFIIKPYKMQVFATYERQYLPQWQHIQNSVTHFIDQFHKAATAPQR